MKKIVVLTGAGISKESGINTFRDTGGTWEQYDVMEVASIQGWHKNPALVLDFYNQRRRALDTVVPNPGHKALVELESKYDVAIITQNVDDLHERAGYSNILHLHGELRKMRSTVYPYAVVDCNRDIEIGQLCENGGQMRPFIVWFGEDVPMIDRAVQICHEADIFIIIGTSLQVYPAAGLIDIVPRNAMKFIVDVELPTLKNYQNLQGIQKSAAIGVPELVTSLLSI